MKLKYFTNIKDKEFEIVISGIIGRDVDGKAIASEIRYLNTIGATKIIERINSQGGDVVQGFDIVDANINSDAIIETVVTGLAASTAGWIASSGTKGHRFIMDYAKAMMHNPEVSGKKLDEMEDGSEKMGLMSIRDSIATILANMSDLYKNEIFDFMNKTTWLNADAWIEGGFADEKISTDTKVEFGVNSKLDEFQNQCEVLYNNFINSNVNIKFKEMSELARFYNLNSEAAEDIILAEAKKEREALDVAQNEIGVLQSNIENKDTILSEKEAEVAELKQKVTSFQNEAIVSIVSNAIEAGKFDEKDKEKLIENAKAIGVENFSLMVQAMKTPHTNVLEELNEEGKPFSKAKTDEELAEVYLDLSKNDKEELKRIKDFEPEYFNKLLKAWEAN